jgi:hypothetical protein
MRANNPTRVLRIRSCLLHSALAVAAAAAPASASAQVCMGLPGFTDASVHLSAAAEFPDSARSYAAGLGAGVPNGVFLNLGGGVVTYQGEEEQARFGFGEIGFARAVGPIEVCPIAGGYLALGPDLFDVKVTTRGGTAGLALGVPFDLPVVTIIPTAAVKYEYVSQKAEQEDVGATTEIIQSGLIDVGLGLLVRDRFSIQPLAHFPFATEYDAEPSFGIFASVILPLPAPGFGR